MKKTIGLAASLIIAGAGLVMFTNTATAQDPVKVDPKHYKVEFENEQVRVLRITYGPHEKSAMHEHPAGVGVFITGGQAKFTMPDGKTVERKWKPGQAAWLPGETHLPENTGTQRFELILVEMKSR